MLTKFLKSINLSSLRKQYNFAYLSKNIRKNSILSIINHKQGFFSSKNESNTDITIQEQCQDVEPEKIQINYNDIKGVKSGDNNHYIIQFTCKKCEHRTTRIFTKRSYHHGIVLIKCEGCEGIHLIADNLGWFEDTSVNVEMIIERNGEKYKKLSAEGLFQISTEDISEEIKKEEPKH